MFQGRMGMTMVWGAIHARFLRWSGYSSHFEINMLFMKLIIKGELTVKVLLEMSDTTLVKMTPSNFIFPLNTK